MLAPRDDSSRLLRCLGLFRLLHDPLASDASLSLGQGWRWVLRNGGCRGDCHGGLGGCLLEVDADLRPIAVLPHLLRDAYGDETVLLLHLEGLVWQQCLLDGVERPSDRLASQRAALGWVVAAAVGLAMQRKREVRVGTRSRVCDAAHGLVHCLLQGLLWLALLFAHLMVGAARATRVIPVEYSV